MKISSWAIACLALLAIGLAAVAVVGQEGPKPIVSTGIAGKTNMDLAHIAAGKKMLDDAVKFLISKRDADGGWSAGPQGQYKPAMTAMVLKVLLQHPDYAPAIEAAAGAGNMPTRKPGTEVDKTVVTKALDVLLKYRQKDGGIYIPQEGQAAYTTAIAVMALKAAKDPKYNEVVKDAVDYLKGLQIVPGQESPDAKKIAADDPRVGGVGYGKPPGFSPNMVVMDYWMGAMEDAGVPSKDPAIQNALGFLSRLQNTETNPMQFAKDGNYDGGFVYSLDESKAGSAGKGMRSYGTVTYAGIKSLLYAGVAKEDPRVKGAYNWIRKYWGLDSNPNLPDAQSQQGLYYYYHVFAKALRAYGETTVKDLKDKEHNWREELVDAMKKRVKDDGSWTNSADRWEEGSPVLVTCYCALALEEVFKN
ncbi:MAG: prenyltransferase/squalene oxidase repeat-containing protein [Phycisphaerae bacterium]